jgi:hypothetical protein
MQSNLTLNTTPGAWEANPTISFGDGDTGFFENSDDNLHIAIGGADKWEIGTTVIGAIGNYKAELRTTTPSSTAPGFAFDSDTNTGIGRAAADQLSLIAGGNETARLTYDGTSKQLIINPGYIQNNATNPTLAFGDGDTGWYENADDNLWLSVDGTARWLLNSNGLMKGNAASGPFINPIGSSATQVNMGPRDEDVDTGLGSAAVNQLSLIAGGIEVARVSNVSSSNISQFIIAPGYIQNNATNPSLAFGDGDTGFMERADDQISMVQVGSERFSFLNGRIYGVGADRPSISFNLNSGSTQPVFHAKRDDTDTGLGSAAADILSFIAGGINAVNITEASNNIVTAFNGNFSVDTDTLYVDSDNDRVGIGSSTR